MVDSKGQPLVKLPELASYQIKVKLTGQARETYNEVFKQLGKIIKGLVKQDQAGAKYSQMRKVDLSFSRSGIPFDSFFCYSQLHTFFGYVKLLAILLSVHLILSKCEPFSSTSLSFSLARMLTNEETMNGQDSR